MKKATCDLSLVPNQHFEDGHLRKTPGRTLKVLFVPLFFFFFFFLISQKMSALDVFVDLFLVVVMRRAVVEIDDVLSAFSVLRFFTTVFPCMLVWFSLLNWQARFGKEDELWTQVIVCWTALAVLGNVINIRLCHTERFAVLISHLLLILFQKKKKKDGRTRNVARWPFLKE
jgi:hypothetical protein